MGNAGARGGRWQPTARAPRIRLWTSQNGKSASQNDRRIQSGDKGAWQELSFDGMASDADKSTTSFATVPNR